jgi:hypothetical protein
LAGYQKGGEVDPHLHSLRRQGMLKLRESG